MNNLINNLPEPIPLGTKSKTWGKVCAVKSGCPRDYLLLDDDGSVTWMDEMALVAILEAEKSPLVGA